MHIFGLSNSSFHYVFDDINIHLLNSCARSSWTTNLSIEKKFELYSTLNILVYSVEKGKNKRLMWGVFSIYFRAKKTKKKNSHIATNIAPIYTNAYSLLISVKYNLRFENMYRLVKIWYNNVSVVMIESNCILIFVHTLVIISNSCLQKLRELIYLSNKLFFCL